MAAEKNFLNLFFLPPPFHILYGKEGGIFMFVYTVRSAKLKWFLLFLLCAAAVGAFFWFSSGNKPAASDGAISLKAGDAAERLAFISQFGWDVKEDPLEVAEVISPSEFDEVYEKYNEIQKDQNLDLSLYSGKRVKRWTYAVRNYPGYETQEDVVQISLLIYEGLVIGGDVCSTELNGFMHGFDFPTAQESTGSTQQAS